MAWASAAASGSDSTEAGDCFVPGWFGCHGFHLLLHPRGREVSGTTRQATIRALFVFPL